MECSDMVSKMVSDAFIPKMALVRQNFPRPQIKDIRVEVNKLINSPNITDTVKAGMRVAVTCGSRGVDNIAIIIKEVCGWVKQRGAVPFIVPTMGSHGGANAECQRQIIESYGVTESFCGVEIHSSMEVVKIGSTKDNEAVYIDENAANADGIIVIGRIKPHTDFRGPFESGILKMMVVGLGKQRGAEVFHKKGPQFCSSNLQKMGEVIINNAKILFGLGIVENAYDETAKMEVMLRNEIIEKEPPLLLEAKELMAKSYIKKVDLLIVDRIGKDISGNGMDPNITGRFGNPYIKGGSIEAKKMTILDLTDETHGQMCGLGYADTTTKRCLDKCDFEASYPNSLTTTLFLAFKVPVVTKSDKEAIGTCLKYCGYNDKKNPRVIRIVDTLHMSEIWVSEALVPAARKHPNMEVISAPCEMPFDSNGNLF